MYKNKREGVEKSQIFFLIYLAINERKRERQIKIINKKLAEVNEIIKFYRTKAQN